MPGELHSGMATEENERMDAMKCRQPEIRRSSCVPSIFQPGILRTLDSIARIFHLNDGVGQIPCADRPLQHPRTSNSIRNLRVRHNTLCSAEILPLSFGKGEGSRRRFSWKERREEDREARFRVLQKAASKTQESQRRSPSQVQEILLGSSN